MDASRKWHFAQEYAGRAPWENDVMRSYGPEYPHTDRAMRHEGNGLFGLTLNFETGTVAEVKIMRSTGFKSLDDAAIAAFTQSKWKPKRWRALVFPVQFQMNRFRTQPRPPGAIPLPHEQRFPSASRLGSRDNDVER